MKKLNLLALFVIALFLLAVPAYSQTSKLAGKWEIRATNSALVGTVVFTGTGNGGTYYAADGSRAAVSNVKSVSGRYSFNVFDKNLKFDGLTFAKQSQLRGLLIEGGAVGTTRKFAVALTKP